MIDQPEVLMAIAAGPYMCWQFGMHVGPSHHDGMPLTLLCFHVFFFSKLIFPL